MRSSAEQAAAALAARVLSGPARLGQVRAVAIDGPAGSGKTTVAAGLAAAFGAALGVAAGAGADPAGGQVATVHLDDLYDGWTGLEGSLWPRLAAQVLEPLRRGRPGRFQRYDWSTGRFAEWVDVPVPAVLLIEGCGAGRRAGDPVVSLRVWVEAPAELRLARGLARDGEAARAHWEAWMVAEQRHFAEQRSRQHADVLVDAWGTMPT